MKLKTFCVTWGKTGIQSYVQAIDREDAIAKTKEDIRVMSSDTQLNVIECHEVDQ